MNGIERIIQRIDSETQEEIDRIQAGAEAKAAEEEEKYRAQAARETEELSARNLRAAAEYEERLVSVSQMEARKVTLGAKQEMVEQAFDLALERLCGLPDEPYADAAAQLMLDAAPTGRGEVIFAPDRRDTVGRAAVEKANALLGGGKLTLSGEDADIRGGFILRDGPVEVNCTFETLIRLQRGKIAGEVAKQLFPEA